MLTEGSNLRLESSSADILADKMVNQYRNGVPVDAIAQISKVTVKEVEDILASKGICVRCSG